MKKDEKRFNKNQICREKCAFDRSSGCKALPRNNSGVKILRKKFKFVRHISFERFRMYIR